MTARPRIEPPARWRAHQVGARPERCTQNQRHSESSGWRKHNCDPKEPAAEVPRSGTHDILLLQPFQAPADTIKNIVEELLSVVAQYTISREAAQLHLAPSSSREAPLNVVI
jgi:hypothetical protein